MAALGEGFQYGLSSNSISSSNKTVVHVKLTDVSLRIIEDYIQKKAAFQQKPSIQFQGNHGTIQLPERNGETKNFQFSLSAIQGDPNGSFDAVCQPNMRHGNRLTLEGSMTNKIQIHATNELFKATKDRVTQAELDSKKVSTKEIDHSGPNISRKKTTVIRNQHPPVARQQPVQPTKPKPSSAPPVNFTKRPSPSYGSQGHAVSPHNPTTMTSSKPTSPSLSTHNPSKRTSGNPAVMSMPYRDRIIHLLAIKAYKKPELMLRLRRDGVREKDKDSLGSILHQVAVSKDNSFSLAKHVYADVRMDWPFYTEEDRQILKKKLQSASSVSPSASPNSRSPDSQSINLTQKKSEKRSLDDNNHYSSHHNAKKKRISLISKPGNTTDHKSSIGERRSSTNNSNTPNLSEKKENIIDAGDSKAPEYMRQYLTIEDNDQRCKYKQDFNEEYEEYRNLHKTLDEVSKKFAELQDLRRKLDKGTSEFEKLEEKIRTEYLLQKSDPKFIEQMSRYKYLHKKLAYIKDLIIDYDQKFLTASS
ncbi:RNA polymerase II [Mactra antiquata]